MDHQYGIATGNKFGIFMDDDEDPLEILRLQEEAKEKAKKEEKTTKKDGKNKSKTDKNKQNKKVLAPVQEQKNKQTDINANKKDDRPRNKPRQNEQTGEQKMDRRPPRENRDRDQPPRRAREDRGEFRERGDRGGERGGDKGTERRFYDRGEEGGRGRGRGRGRGGRGRGGFGQPSGGGFDRFGKREYERHSGSDRTSGVKAVDKKEGGGAYNWGTVSDEIDEQLNNTNVSTEESPDWPATGEEVENQDPSSPKADGEEGVESEPVEEEPKEMTLDEYKAMQRESRTQQQFKLRKAGEGVDSAQWKKTYVLKKAKEEHDEEEEDEDDEDYDTHRQKKNLVKIEITFNDTPRRGRGGRRPRGDRGGRGGYGRGGDRGPRRESEGEGRSPRGGYGRGRGGGGGGRGGGGRSGSGRRDQAPNVEDELEFPSIGKPAAGSP